MSIIPSPKQFETIMQLAAHDIVFQEVPGEISLAFYISGCSLACDGCHSEMLWSKKGGVELTEQEFLSLLNRYGSMVSCVLFMGGEWHETDLIERLKLAKSLGYKTALYTGEESVSSEIERHLDFLKVGRFIKDLGGLAFPNTNQKFISVLTGQSLNHLFH